MDTAEHRVNMFNLANSRRRAGLPSWEYRVHGFKAALELYDTDNFDTLIESRDAVVAAIKASNWYRKSDEFGNLHEVIDELTDVGHPEIDWDDDYNAERHFNACLEQIYTLADYDRAWLG